MKKSLVVFLVVLAILVTACAPKETNSMSLDSNSGNSSSESLSPTESVQQPVPEVGTTLPESSSAQTSGSNSTSSDSQSVSASTITFADSGKTFYYHPGDSFLLNLGDEIYEWSATVENQNVVSLKVGVMVIKGAQGIFDALAPGTTTLTAVGDPLCRKASPPCGTPTILFKATIVVE